MAFLTGILHVKDELFGDGEHLIERWLHFAPELDVTIVGGRAMVSARGESVAVVAGDALSSVEVSASEVSDSYGSRRPAKVLRFLTRVEIPATLQLVLMPVGAAHPL